MTGSGRRQLIAGASLTAMSMALLLGPSEAQAQCVGNGNTLTCTGNLSEGVQNPSDFTVPPIEIVIIEDVTEDIAPTQARPDDREGVFYRAEFSDASEIRLDVDLGNFAVRNTVTEPGALGVAATAQESDLFITMRGDISTMGERDAHALAGVTAVGGDVSIISSGNRTTAGEFSNGIYGAILGTFGFATQNGQQIIIIDETGQVINVPGPNGGNGNIGITHSGNILTTGVNADGVRAFLGAGAINLDLTGNIETRGESGSAIVAQGFGANAAISIASQGNLRTSGADSAAIFAAALQDGSIDIRSAGSITTSGANSDGVSAAIGGNGNIDRDLAGDIRTGNSRGIRAYVFGDGNITANIDGRVINSRASAFEATIDGDGDIDLMFEQSFSSSLAAGVRAETGNGDITIEVNQNSFASGTDSDAISALVRGDGNITLRSNGILETGSAGLRARLNGAGDITLVANRISSSSSTPAGAQSPFLLFADHNGTGDIAITSNDVLFARTAGGGGISADHSGTGDIHITTNDQIFDLRNDSVGILAFHQGAGNVLIDVNGNIAVSSSRNSDAIQVSASNGFGSTVNLNTETIAGGSNGAVGVSFVQIDDRTDVDHCPQYRREYDAERSLGRGDPFCQYQ